MKAPQFIVVVLVFISMAASMNEYNKGRERGIVAVVAIIYQFVYLALLAWGGFFK